MTKINDLTGLNFGKLTVIERDFSKRRVAWVCLCECGNITSGYSNDIINGKKKSCGCYKKESAISRQFKNLLNMRFGRLVVIARAEDYVYGNIRYTKWKCLCDCGNYKEVFSSHLLGGKVISCGCYRKEVNRLKQKENLSGMKFGKLLVIEETENLVTFSKESRTAWICLCDCGNIVTVRSKNLKNGTIVSCGCSKESAIASGLKSYLQEKYDCVFEYKIVKNPITGRFLFYDIYIKDNIFIEVNGIQHYEMGYFHVDMGKRLGVSTEEAFEYQLYKDNLKKNYATENGIYIEIDIRSVTSVDSAIKYIENILSNI